MGKPIRTNRYRLEKILRYIEKKNLDIKPYLKGYDIDICKKCKFKPEDGKQSSCSKEKCKFRIRRWLQGGIGYELKREK